MMYLSFIFYDVLCIEPLYSLNLMVILDDFHGFCVQSYIFMLWSILFVPIILSPYYFLWLLNYFLKGEKYIFQGYW